MIASHFARIYDVLKRDASVYQQHISISLDLQYDTPLS
jgi:hypothetical protein